MRIYTDGSCLGNPGPGGWAWAIDDIVYDSGYVEDTTNNRMELAAVLEAITSVQRRNLIIVTDSAYVVNCFTSRWHLSWRNGYNRKNKEIVNWDLWEPLVEIVKLRNILFEKVKGHSGVPMNEFVDRLARQAARGR